MRFNLIPILTCTVFPLVCSAEPSDTSASVVQWARSVSDAQTRMVWAMRLDAVPGRAFVDRSEIDHPIAYCIELGSAPAEGDRWLDAARELAGRLPEAPDYRVTLVRPDGRQIIAHAGTPILSITDGVGGPSGGMTFRSPTALARMIAARADTAHPATIEPLPGGALVRIADLGLEAELISRDDAWGVRRYTIRSHDRITDEVEFDGFTRAEALPLLLPAGMTSRLASPDLEGASIKNGMLTGVGASSLRPHATGRLISAKVGPGLPPAGRAINLDRWTPPERIPTAAERAQAPFVANAAGQKPHNPGVPVWVLAGSVSGVIAVGLALWAWRQR